MRGFYWIVCTDSPVFLQIGYIPSMPPCAWKILMSGQESMAKIGEIWISSLILYVFKITKVVCAICKKKKKRLKQSTGGKNFSDCHISPHPDLNI